MTDTTQAQPDNSPEQFTGERVDAFEGGQDEASGGKPIILFKTSKGRYVRSEHVAPYIQSGQIRSPYQASQVKGISQKPKTWKEQQEMNETLQGQQGMANLDVAEKNATTLGLNPDEYDQELQKAGVYNTQEGQTASKRYREKVTGIMAPVKDAEQRMNFLFGPATQAAFSRAKEGEQQAVQTPPDTTQGAPTAITYRQPTGLESRTMALAPDVASGAADVDDAQKEMTDARKQEQLFGGRKELAKMSFAGKKQLQDEKPKPAPKIPKPPKAGEVAPALQLTADDIQVAKDLASGSLDPRTFEGMYTKFGQKGQQRIPAVYAYARKLNPDLNIAQRGLEYKWGSNAGATKTIAAANNALSNIDKIVKVSDEWSRTGSPGLNAMIKFGQRQLGYKNATNIQELQTAIGDEVAGVLGYGTSSDLKTKLGIDLTNPNVSAENFRSNMVILKDLLATRAKTMARPMGMYGDRPGITPPTTKDIEVPDMSKGVDYKDIQPGPYIDPNGVRRIKK